MVHFVLLLLFWTFADRLDREDTREGLRDRNRQVWVRGAFYGNHLMYTLRDMISAHEDGRLTAPTILYHGMD